MTLNWPIKESPALFIFFRWQFEIIISILRRTNSHFIKIIWIIVWFYWDLFNLISSAITSSQQFRWWSPRGIIFQRLKNDGFEISLETYSTSRRFGDDEKGSVKLVPYYMGLTKNNDGVIKFNFLMKLKNPKRLQTKNSSNWKILFFFSPLNTLDTGIILILC